MSHGEACLLNFQLTEVHMEDYWNLSTNWQLVVDAHGSWRVEILLQLQHVEAPDLFRLIPRPCTAMAVLCALAVARDKVSLRSCCKSADVHSSHFQRWLGLWVMVISFFRCSLTWMGKHRHACDVIVKPCSKYCKTIDQAARWMPQLIYLMPEISAGRNLAGYCGPACRASRCYERFWRYYGTRS